MSQGSFLLMSTETRTWLERLSLQQVRYCKRQDNGRYLPELFKWVGRRLKASTHLAFHIDYPLWREYLCCHVGDPLTHLLSSNQKLNANLETLDLTMGDWWKWYVDAALLSWLQDWVLFSCSRLKTVSLALEKAPTWLMQCPSLQHLCLYFPNHLASSKGGAHFTELPTSLNHTNLPNLQTLFLQGGGEDIGGTNFQGSGSLGVVHIQNCWLNELLLPASCQLRVSAQSEGLIARMDKSREHPLVSNASYVCLPTDLAERVTPDGCLSDDEEERELRTSAVGIPDIFSNTCSLHLTCPDEDYRGLRLRWRERSWERCTVHDDHVPYQKYCHMSLIPLRCLPKQWRHVNLKELLIEGDRLGVVIPALPNLETLLVSCKRSVALDFTDSEYLGRTITRMVISAPQMHFQAEQKQDLCNALTARGLELAGSCKGSSRIAVHTINDPNPSIAEVEEQFKNGFKFDCRCRACPSCLGIGIKILEREDPSKNGGFDIENLKV